MKKNLHHETKRKNSKEKLKHGDDDRMQSSHTCLFEILERYSVNMDIIKSCEGCETLLSC